MPDAYKPLSGTGGRCTRTHGALGLVDIMEQFTAGNAAVTANWNL